MNDKKLYRLLLDVEEPCCQLEPEEQAALERLVENPAFQFFAVGNPVMYSDPLGVFVESELKKP